MIEQERTAIAHKLYNYYLKKEQEKREQAIKLYNSGKYEEIRRNFSHYFNAKYKQVEIENTELNAFLKQVEEIKSNIPSNAMQIEIMTGREDSLYINWLECSVLNSQKCKSLARHWATDAAWKIEHQPNGKDAKRALNHIGL